MPEARRASVVLAQMYSWQSQPRTFPNAQAPAAQWDMGQGRGYLSWGRAEDGVGQRTR